MSTVSSIGSVEVSVRTDLGVATAPQARVLSLRDPTNKMSKSHPDSRTRILLTDPPSLMRDKVRTAVTDSEPTISYDPVKRPGVSNLLGILAGLSSNSTTMEDLVSSFEGKNIKDLKDAVGDKVEEVLVPFQREFQRVRAEQGYLEQMEEEGRMKARARAERTMQEVRNVVGLGYSE